MNNLKNIRIQKGLSQKQVADLCNVKQPTYSRIESGIRTPSVQLAKKIAKVLELNWTIFFE